MFWSKIWFFLVATLAAAATVAALLMPRSAEREEQQNEERLLERACSVTEILLRDNARSRVEFATGFARTSGPDMRIDRIARRASGEDPLSSTILRDGDAALSELVDHIEGAAPSFVLLVDRRGRVVAAHGTEFFEPRREMRGRPLIDEALAGYVRDDLWVADEDLYRVAASPIELEGDWVGAVVLGHALDNSFAGQIADTLQVDVGFYAAGAPLAASNPVRIHESVLETFDVAPAGEERPDAGDCAAFEAGVVVAGGTSYRALAARLPGEAGELGGMYTVFVEHTDSVGLTGMLSRVQRSDLSISQFPWIPVVLILLAVVAGGLVLLALEGDRPLRRLNDEAVEIAKGERERFDEEKHGGKFGSIARSVNISVDKLKREAKAAQRDLDELLGPAPEPSVRASMPDMGASLAGPGSGSPGATAGESAGTPQAPPPSAFFTDREKSGASGGGGADPLGLENQGRGADSAKAPPPAGSAKAAGSGPPPVPGGADKGAKGAAKPEGKESGGPPPIPSGPAAGASGSAADASGSAADASGSARAIDDDILSDDEEDEGLMTRTDGPSPSFDEAATRVAEPASGDGGAGEETYFRQIYDEFLALKKSCGEETKNLTFETFADKLRNNRDQLIAKHGCKSVRFQVYEKNGRAALKASPIKG